MTLQVSVVMGVYNGERYLRAAVESVLSQQGVTLEFIVVDDGSTDGTPAILAEIQASDSRMHVLTQRNAGLTRALIAGCQAARGEFIARQDSDDLSLPGRLARQRELLAADPQIVIASCWSEMVGPADELLMVHKRPSDPVEATDWLVRRRIGPPGHGSVMFRRDAYERAGGYRALFYYAQDSDLWVRLAMIGQISYVPELLYRYRVEPQSISGTKTVVREAYQRLVNRLHVARHAGEDEQAIIAATQLPSPHLAKPTESSEAATLYFIGRCLVARSDSRATSYLRRSVSLRPGFARGWLVLAWATAQYCVQHLTGRAHRGRAA